MAYSADPSSFGSGAGEGKGMWRRHTHTHTPRTYKVAHRTGRMKQTQPGKEKGHPQPFCISTTVSDISLAKQSKMGVCFQDFSCLTDSHSFPVGPY